LPLWLEIIGEIATIMSGLAAVATVLFMFLQSRKQGQGVNQTDSKGVQRHIPARPSRVFGGVSVRETVSGKLFSWVLGGMLSVFPLVLAALLLLFSGNAQNLMQLVLSVTSHGELLLISAALSTIALSTNLRSTRVERHHWWIMFTALSFTNLFTAGAYFSTIVFRDVAGVVQDSRGILLVSAVVFISSLITSSATVLIASISDRE
jgi:hypothetical protein